MATSFTVSNAAQLQTALGQVSAGGTIVLNSGNYGTVNLNNLNFSSDVTLVSANPDDPAVMTELNVVNSSHLVVESVHVASTSNGSLGSRVVNIDSSNNITFSNSEVNGPVDGDFSGHYGILARSSSNITLQNNYVHDVLNGVTGFGVSNFQVLENHVDYVGSDFFKMSGIRGGLIEDNIGGGHANKVPGAHADFVQFESSSNDVVLRGNVYLAQTTPWVQGIFMSDGVYTNILIEQNVIYSGMMNGISVASGSSNVTIRNNTVLTMPNDGHPGALISAPGGSNTITNNISASYDGSTNGTNIVAQHDNPNDVNYYGDLFANAYAGLGITIEDLAPATSGTNLNIGAFARIQELVNGVAWTPDPGRPPVVVVPETPDVSEPTTPAAPLPDAIDGTVFSLVGDTEISGSGSVIEVAHNNALSISAGTIALSFNADTVSGAHAILSKDASYYGGGGNHFAAWIENGTLNLRFQDGNGDKTFSVSGISASKDYDLHITFGDGTVSAMLDGTSIGSAAFNMDWTKNVEHMQVGANGWSSASGSSGYAQVFDGTISDLVIIDGKATPADVAALLGQDVVSPEPEPEPTPAEPEPEPTPEPEPEPEPTKPDPEPTPAPSGAVNVAYQIAGDVEITGRRDVLEVAPSDRLNLDSGTIALTFNADSVRHGRGILSKDAIDYSGGGNHFSTWIEDGTLNVRFQDGSSDQTFSVKNIQTNHDYDLQVTFGDGSVSAWLDGTLIGNADFDMTWSNNNEYMQVGASGWASDSGESGFTRTFSKTQIFDGTISDVMIVEGKYSPDQLADALANDTPAAPVEDGGTDNGVDPGHAAVFAMLGDNEFTGARGGIVNLDHDADLALSEGTIAFSFEADAVNGQRGLISKDASYYEGGGNHFSAWVENGTLNVRFQDEDSDAVFRAHGIAANTEYDVVATFEDDRVALYLDGELVGSQSFDMDWTGNHENLQVGGLGWSSSAGGDTVVAAFDGTISDVQIFDEAMSPQDYDFFTA